MEVHHVNKTMETRFENGIGIGIGNGHYSPRHNSHHTGPKLSLSWLDIRVFYIRISKCEINNELTPEHLTLNHVPLNRDTLLEVNGVRTSIYSDCVSTLLRRDRLDKKSEEVTFVSTDSFRTTGSVKFEVFDKDVLLVSGVLDLCHGNGIHEDSDGYVSRWRMECETDMVAGNGFLKGVELEIPVIEVCLAGSFGGNPIILSKNLQVFYRKKQMRKGLLEAIPENEAIVNQGEGSSSLSLKDADYPNYKHEHDYHSLYSGMEYGEGEDGELSWFNAGVRVGVGIGLSVCLGIGIGVGLLARTYHGTTRNFRRGLL